MAKKWAAISFGEADVLAAIDTIAQENEGYDPLFTLKMDKNEAAEFLERNESEIEDAMVVAGIECLKEKLRRVEAARKDDTLSGQPAS